MAEALPLYFHTDTFPSGTITQLFSLSWVLFVNTHVKEMKVCFAVDMNDYVIDPYSKQSDTQWLFKA